MNIMRAIITIYWACAALFLSWINWNLTRKYGAHGGWFFVLICALFLARSIYLLIAGR